MVKELGEGISSRVMLAQHRLTKEKFAIKIISWTYLREERLRVMLDREIDTLK